MARSNRVAAIREMSGPFAQLKLCTVTQLTPILVALDGTDDLKGVSIPGAFYTLGPALAIWQPPALPLIIPIGT
ncbi:hypothetical protein [Glaciihabitans sp. dw_435]|uniref:hypothetical protein n=1 Tax=Glaciihabitans sp. dw_435 TaxID=2720081 RepID=UPI001BD68213|nr:hypothetical protein [Glaciihabitans sp. dw_435]